MPVRIQAGAFGPSRPETDLWLSPGHAVCLDVLGEVFVPASSLINGASVAQVDVETVTYWHVELDSHDVLLANGMPAESYMDVGNRAFFATGQGAIDPDRATATGPWDYCRPFHQDGSLVEVLRARLKARALTLGWAVDAAPLAGLHLLVDGARIEADVDGLKARFVVPATAKDVWLVSEVGVPAHLGLTVHGDDRRLGACVGKLSVDDGLGPRREIAIDDVRLGEGFHKAEADHRWTDGRARLPATLWDGCRGAFFLRVDLAAVAEPRWVAPGSMALPALPVPAPVQAAAGAQRDMRPMGEASTDAASLVPSTPLRFGFAERRRSGFEQGRA